LKQLAENHKAYIETVSHCARSVSTEKYMNEALDLIRQLARERFYGALTLKFEAGRITTIKKEQTIKPADLTDLSEPPRSQDDNREAK
jgi:hypothetical protein